MRCSGQTAAADIQTMPTGINYPIAGTGNSRVKSEYDHMDMLQIKATLLYGFGVNPRNVLFGCKVLNQLGQLLSAGNSQARRLHTDEFLFRGGTA